MQDKLRLITLFNCKICFKPDICCVSSYTRISNKKFKI